MRMLIWDFDGVIADTVKECYIITLAAIEREKAAMAREAGISEFKRIPFSDFKIYRANSVNAPDFFANYILQMQGRDLSEKNLEKIYALHPIFLKHMDELFYKERTRLQNADKEKYFSTLKIYGGVPEVLQKLKARGFRQVIMSARDTHSIKEILSHFKLRDYFELIIGHEVKKGDRHVKALQIKLLKKHFERENSRREEINYYFIDDIPFNLKKLEGFAQLLFAEWGYGKLDDAYVKAVRIKAPRKLLTYFKNK